MKMKITALTLALGMMCTFSAFAAGELRYGVSITDGCLGWEGTERILRDAARRLAEGR